MLVILRFTYVFYERGLLMGLTIGMVVGLEAPVAGALLAVVVDKLLALRMPIKKTAAEP